MRVRMLTAWLGIAAAAALPLCASTITIGPSGVGSIGNQLNIGLPGNDPGPGGLSAVLVYNLPFTGTQGDVFLTFADYNNAALDVIRFNGDRTLIFYQANVDGGPDLPGNAPSPPGALYGNVIELDEITPHNQSLAVYAPAAGQPGYDESNPTYDIYTYTATPEPSTAAMVLAACLLGGSLSLVRRLKAAVLSKRL